MAGASFCYREAHRRDAESAEEEEYGSGRGDSSGCLARGSPSVAVRSLILSAFSVSVVDFPYGQR